MQNQPNIEELFKSGLSDVEVTPSAEGWSGIHEQLDDKDLESLFRNELGNNLVNPSSGVWKGIVAYLPVHSFWQFGLKSFNIYSVTALVAVLAGMLFVTVSMRDQETSVVTEEAIVEVTENSDQSKASILPINTEEAETDTKKDIIASSPPVKETVNKSFTEKTPKASIVSSNVKSENSDGGNTTQVAQNPKIQNNNSLVLLDGSDEDFEKDKKRKDKKKKNKKKSKKQNAKKQNDNIELPVKQEVASEKQPVEILNEIPQKSIVHVDTLVVYDTIQYYDTLIVNKMKAPISSVSLWSVSPRMNVFGSNSIHTSNNRDFEELSSLYNTSNSSSLSYSFGLGVNYDYKNWRVSSGLDYTSIQEEFNYETQRIETIPVRKYTLKEDGFYMGVEENTYMKYEPQYVLRRDTISTSYTIHRVDYDSYTVIDTIWKYKIDTKIIHVSDSVEVVSYDTVRVATYDTTYYNSVDTNVYTTYYQNINKYTYLEVPLSISYAFNFKKLTLRPTVGALVGIMLNAKGKGISTQNRNEVYSLSDLDLPFMNLQISMLFGLGVEYRIQSNMSVYVQPFYRRSLSSIYQQESVIDKRFSGVGASFGLSFYFN